MADLPGFDGSDRANPGVVSGAYPLDPAALGHQEVQQEAP